MAKKLEQAALDGNVPTYVSRDNQTIESAIGRLARECPVPEMLRHCQRA